MRLEVLLALLAEERQKRGQDALGKDPIPKEEVNSIRFKGISDEDIKKYVIPRLVQWEIDGDFSKQNLKVFLQTSTDIHLSPDPFRHEVNKTIEQRRMDSLSRLLIVANTITPCIAVAFYKGELIIASNTPKGKTEIELTDYLSRKMVIIQNFLSAIAKDVNCEPVAAKISIQFSKRAKLLAHQAVKLLVSEDCGGTGEILPSKAHRKHTSNKDHLKNALFKLGQSYLLGLYTNGAQGFSREDIRALCSSTITVITPNVEELGSLELHAEQAILHYLNEAHNFEQETSVSKVNIGISKLCCQACYAVLSRSEKVAFRGSHDMEFPSVLDIGTGVAFTGIRTKKTADPYPSDSESECEFFEPEDETGEDAIFAVPSLDKLLKTSPLPSLKTGEKHRLFKPCQDNVEEDASASKLDKPKSTSRTKAKKC
jgi:hypothetical protein